MKRVAKQAKRRSSSRTFLRASLGTVPENFPMMTSLYAKAETELRKRRKNHPPGADDTDPRRMLHELEVHQVELELQNAELRKARDELEEALERYTDLYDFAPTGYFTLGADGMIQMVNLTGASLAGIERSALVGRPLASLAAPASRHLLAAFLKQVFASPVKQSGDFELSSPGHALRTVNIEALRLPDKQECRLAIADITGRKRAEEVQRRAHFLAGSNRKLKQEIVRRQAVEKSLKASEQNQKDLLDQSHSLQEQLRYLSRQVLRVQEEERKRISRELHDVISQTLVGVHLCLARLTKQSGPERDLAADIARTQRLVEKLMNTVHEFARKLRPVALDELGLVPALTSHMKNFTAETGVRSYLTAFSDVEKLDDEQRTVLFRVAQEAIANVARHATSSRLEVTIEKLTDGIGMKIKDDGKSFDVKGAMQVRGGKRLGLLGMRERLEMAGGKLTIQSSPDAGTTVAAWIPLKGKLAVQKKQAGIMGRKGFGTGRKKALLTRAC